MTELLLHDTLSGTLQKVTPSNGQSLRFYACGPTVYGPAHVGNFRTFVVQDVFRRVVESLGIKITHVRNITDVDDKTIRDAEKSNTPLQKFTQQWTAAFHADSKKLNLLPPHIEPSAVAHISDQIALIEKLIARNHAYPSDDGSVYFKIASFPEYGRLSKLDKRELKLGSAQAQHQTCDGDEYQKDSLADFALWKARKPEDGANYWASPWGEGRPGWHLECSAMSVKYLGQNFDWHSGGVDLLFPHHENEIAQSVCAHGGDFAQHWFHIAHLMVDGGKMSKSLGNVYRLEDIEAWGFSGIEMRYALLSCHYRHPLNFTRECLHAAHQTLRRLQKLAQSIYDSASASATDSTITEQDNSDNMRESSPFQPVWDALLDDLNTPKAFGALFVALKKITSQKNNSETSQNIWQELQQILRALGLDYSLLPKEKTPTNEAIPQEIQNLADQRWQAKQNKDWATADQLRQQLTEQGWTVKDTKEGWELEQNKAV